MNTQNKGPNPKSIEVIGKIPTGHDPFMSLSLSLTRTSLENKLWFIREHMLMSQPNLELGAHSSTTFPRFLFTKRKSEFGLEELDEMSAGR